MKVAYLTVKERMGNDSLMSSGYANLDMVTQMPASEIGVYTSIADLKADAADFDVILLEIAGWMPDREKLTFLNDIPVFVAGFHLDSWKPVYWCETGVNVDLSIFIYREITLRLKPKLAEQDQFLWLPPRVKMYDMKPERDIDWLHWGHIGREYPFRMFCYYAMVSLSTGGPRIKHANIRQEYEAHLWLQDVTLFGKQYRSARVNSSYGAPHCNGEELAEILHRSKVNPTGPPTQRLFKAPVARYIENAACGVVSLTTKFDDAEDLGFVHGENIWYTTPETFFGDMDYLLTHDDHWKEMSQNARELVRTRHTTEIRALRLYSELRTRTGIE